MVKTAYKVGQTEIETLPMSPTTTSELLCKHSRTYTPSTHLQTNGTYTVYMHG